MTKQRRLILDIVNRTREHPTAEQIYLQAREAMPAIAMATVYNNLNYLARHGLIRRVGMCNAPDRYDCAGEEHQHLICDCCGRVEDIRLPDFLEPVRRQGYDIRGFDLTVHDLCNTCREKRGGNAHGSESNV